MMPTLLHVSIAASPLVILLTLLRSLLKDRVPPRVFLALYGLVLCRLLLPVWVPVPTEQLKPLLNPIYGGVFNFTRLAVAAAPSQRLLVAVWSAAALGLLGYTIFRHLRSLWVWRVAVPLERPAVQAWVKEHAGRRKVRLLMIENANDVFSYGLLHPVIVMSEEIIDSRSDHEVTQMAAHELGHIRGLHTLLQYATLAVCSLHWFNPLVWLLTVLVLRDMELAADASAKRYLGKEGAKGYAKMLLSLSEKPAKRKMVTSLFAPSLVERIKAIVKPKRKSRIVSGIVIILSIVTFAIFITTPMNPQKADLLGSRHLHYDEDIEEYLQRVSEDGYSLIKGAPSQ